MLLFLRTYTKFPIVSHRTSSMLNLMFMGSVSRPWLIQSYFSNRKQGTKINNALSSWKEILFGVLQGSILGWLSLYAICLQLWITQTLEAMLMIIHNTLFYKQQSCWGLRLKNGQKIKQLLCNFPVSISESY